MKLWRSPRLTLLPLLFLSFFVLVMTLVVFKFSLLEPIPLFVIPWFLSFLLLSSNIIEYPQILSSESFQIIFFAFLAFVSSALFIDISDKDWVKVHGQNCKKIF